MKTNYSNNAVTNKIPIQSMNDTSSLLSPYDQKTTLDGKFERIDLRLPNLLVLIEQQPPLINEVLPGVEPGRCDALALKTFGECGANAVREGVPRLLEFFTSFGTSKTIIESTISGTWNFVNPKWV